MVIAGQGDAGVPTVRHPLTFSVTPPRYDLPPPRLDEHGEQIRAWLGSDPDQAGGVMTEPRFPTSLGTSDADTITLLGQDLAADLMGQVGFGELALWLVTQQRPAPSQVRVFEAVLVALADHGFTPTAIAARLTYLSAPDSVQGALAAGLLGGGSRFLGVTEDTGRFLAAALAEAGAGDHPPGDDAGWDAIALAAVQRARDGAVFVPGLGHPVHKVTDPRTPGLFGIAREEGQFGPHLRLFEADRPGPPAGARPHAAAERGRHLRGGAGRPRPAGQPAARIRAARPHRGAARADRRGAAPFGRHGHLPDRGPQRRIPAPA